jgi:hypothetical protein
MTPVLFIVHAYGIIAKGTNIELKKSLVVLFSDSLCVLDVSSAVNNITGAHKKRAFKGAHVITWKLGYFYYSLVKFLTFQA